MQSTAASQFISTTGESLENWYLYYRKFHVLVCRLLCIQRYVGGNHDVSVRTSKQLSYHEPLCSKGCISLGLILSMQKLDCKYSENPHLPGPHTVGSWHMCCYTRSHFHCM